MGLRKLNLFDDFIIYKVFNIVKPKIMAIKLQKMLKFVLLDNFLSFIFSLKLKFGIFFFLGLSVTLL